MSKKTTLVQPPKGFRDFLPRQAQLRRFVVGEMISVFENFGFRPLETPAVEYAKLLEGKYGEEERLIFKFKDRGGRDLALRFDQTVPLARVMAQHKNQIVKPFKRYQIQKNWRAEKPQAGRFREFTQCDFDIVGSSSPLADSEVIAVVHNILKKLGFKKFLILFNDRRVLSEMIKQSSIKKSNELATIRALDKLEKIGEEEVIKLLEDIGISQSKIEKLMQAIGKRPVLPKKKRSEISLDPINKITNNLKYFKVPRTKILYTPTLARGLDYYTGMILEVSIQDYSGGSLGGGGRYDKLLGIFGKQNLPAVGFSFGLDRVIEAMEENNLLPQIKAPAKVLVTIFNRDLVSESIKLATSLRKQGVAVELYLDLEDKLDKQIKYADNQGIPQAAILGPDEVANKQVTIKTLETGAQQTIEAKKLPEILV